MQILTPNKDNKLVNRLILDNGITLITIENQASDLIAGRIFLKNAGSRWETREKAGVSHLLAAVITKGTESLSSLEIAETIESIGASLAADAAADYFAISLKTVSADFAKILRLTGEVMRSPTFPEAEVELEKHLTFQSLRAQQEQPFNIAFSQLREAMYQQHPYGVSILGTENSIINLTREDLLEYHQTYFRPDNLVIGLSGRLSCQDAVNLVEEVFGDWQIPSKPRAVIPLAPLNSQISHRVTHQETQQSVVMLGYLAAPVKEHHDYLTLKLLSTYLGNGLSSRLFVELREKRGLAYDVSAFYPTRLDYSQFVVYMGTSPENTAVALEGLNTEVARLSQQELTREELQGAKNKLLGQYALGKQTNAEIAQVYGWYETLGLGIEFDQQFQQDVIKITSEMVQEVACRYLTTPYISLVGPEAIIRNQIPSSIYPA